MKKLLSLTIVLITLFSCSKEDNDPTTTKDPIIGIWYIYSERGEVITDECYKKGFYDFKEDSSFSFNDFYINDKNKACELGKITKGTWSKIENNKYSIKSEGEEDATIKAEFSNDNKTLKMVFSPEYSIVVKKK